MHQLHARKWNQTGELLTFAKFRIAKQMDHHLQQMEEQREATHDDFGLHI